MPGEPESYQRWHDVLCISEVASENLKQARQYFIEVFGMRADEKAVDLKIQQLFDEACSRWIDGWNSAESVSTTIAVPMELILAITLREGFNRKTGRQKRSSYRQHNLEASVRWAKRRAAELRQNGVGRGPAKEKAIREAEQGGRGDRWFNGPDASAIRDNWSKIEVSPPRKNIRG